MTAICYPHPRGPSKRYINLVIWSRPRVNNCLCLISHFLSSCLLVSSSSLLFFHWKCLLGYQAVKFICDCTSGITGHSCLLPIFKFNLQLYYLTTQAVIVFYHFKFNLQLYYLTTQAVIVFYQFKFNCSCTSGLLRLSCVLPIQEQRFII